MGHNPTSSILLRARARLRSDRGRTPVLLTISLQIGIGVRSAQRLHRYQTRILGTPDVGAFLKRDEMHRFVEGSCAFVRRRGQRRATGLDLKQGDSLRPEIA